MAKLVGWATMTDDDWQTFTEYEWQVFDDEGHEDAVTNQATVEQTDVYTPGAEESEVH